MPGRPRLGVDSGGAPAGQTLRDLLDRVGPGLLQLAVAGQDILERPVTGVYIHDPLVDVPPGPGQVLLAVGVQGETESAVELLGKAAVAQYAVAVVHLDGEVPAPLAEAAQDRRIGLLTAPFDVPWAHLATMLRVGITTSPHELAGVPLGDLFAFANSLAKRVGGAVTIEDPQSHVLAYSSVREDVDEPRKETILGRQVPQKYMRVLQERGVFRQLLTSDDVVDMEASPEVNLSRRVAISVRAAGEFLGSIWVAETGGPLAPSHREALREAAQTAALHIIRHRMELHAESNLRRSMVRDLLEGTSADVAAVRLALEPEADYAVVAFESAGPSSRTNRLLEVVELYCSFSQPAAVALDVGPRVYVVVSGDATRHRELRRFASEGARQATNATQAQVYAAVGRTVTSVDRVLSSRQDADRVMRVLLRPESDRSVADLADVRASANLLEILDVLRERPHLREGPLDVIGRKGGERADLVQTVRAYLDSFGDVRKAAASMQVHPNTFRYRLRRAAELAEVDLEDPAERLMLSLQLRLAT